MQLLSIWGAGILPKDAVANFRNDARDGAKPAAKSGAGCFILHHCIVKKQRLAASEQGTRSSAGAVCDEKIIGNNRSICRIHIHRSSATGT
jgi:hypothetical protein